MTDHYKILGIERFATPEEVKKAYFVMAKKYHPDSGDDTEVQKFHEVAEAYKILSDPDSRKVYDISLGVIEEGKNDIQEESEFKVVRSSKREAYRDVELKEFHRNRFKSAVWRVIGFTAFIAMIAYIVALVLLGTALLGLIAGLAIGFSLSVNKNFNLSSYFESDRAHRTFRIFTWVLLFLGLSYFVWLVLKSVFN